MALVVDELSVNGTLPPSIFEIDGERASAIWDSDKNAFLKGKAPTGAPNACKPAAPVALSGVK